jgi:hypothetical protein
MIIHGYRTGRDKQTNEIHTPVSLAIDLTRMLEAHGTVSRFNSKDGYNEEWFYEVPKKGAILFFLSPRGNDLKIVQEHDVTALVTCAGFDEESEEFKRLNSALNELHSKYHTGLEDTVR